MLTRIIRRTVVEVVVPPPTLLPFPVARRAATLAAALALAGCVPALPQGAAREASTAMPASFRGDLGVQSAAFLDYRELFADPGLVALVDEALEHNQELNIAVQENLIASYEVMSRRGEIFPRLTGDLGGGVERVSASSSQGASDEMAGLDPNLQGYSAGVYASWEIDIWGRLRNLADAAAHRYLASVEGRRFMTTELVAEIARLYYELMALDRRLEVVSESVRLQENAVAAARLQWQAGRTTSLAVTRFEAELADFRGRRFEIQQQLVETENRLNFLVGRYPQPIARASAGFMALEPRPVEAGLPSQLLINRPDVRAAELQMRAARLDVRAARARYFPALSIEAGIGYSSFDILRLVETPGSIFFSIFGGLAAPLMNRAGIDADYYGADAAQRQAILSYERAILTAYIEVVNRLSLVDNLAGSYAERERRVARLSDSIDIATQLFLSARADYLEVLTARRDSLDAQLELIETKQRQMAAVVSLYQALGGGWRRGGED